VSVGLNDFDELSGDWRKQTRRRWTQEERRAMVLASLLPGASLARVAREHGVNTNLLWNWRRKFRQEGMMLSVQSPKASVEFVPIGTVVEAVVSDSMAAGRMELNLKDGVRIMVDAKVDEQALIRVLCALKAAI
jgi:transposase